MKNLLIVSLFFLVISCQEEPPTPISAPPSIVPGYHLEYIGYMLGRDYYKPNEVVLNFDTSNKILTISGSRDSIFYRNGSFPYDVRDTTYPFRNPRDQKYYDKTETLLHLPTLTNNYMIYRQDSIKIYVIIDFIRSMADDEAYCSFTKR